MAKGFFDVDGFYSALDFQRFSRRLNWKQVAEETGVSPSTLSRLGKGLKPDIDSVAALMVWAELDANRFMVKDPGSQAASEPLAGITAHLRADRHLTPQAAQALDAVIRAAYQELRKLQE